MPYTLRMAKIHPDLLKWRPVDAGGYAERAVAEQLRDGLPDSFDVFHSVDWSTVDAGVQRFGEMDAVVVDPQGHLVLLEVKAGNLEEQPASDHSDGFSQLLKRYGGIDKNAIGQSGGQIKAMRHSLKREGFEGFKVAHLLVLPDHQIKTASLNLPRDRIVDAKELPDLCRRVLQVINQGQESLGNDHGERARLLLFLANFFQLAPDPTARIGMLNSMVTRLSDGLATWVPRIRNDAGLYVIEATAGSGKTQLALRLLSDAGVKGARSMYVCFNRPLADHIARIAPANAQVNNFHEMAVEHYRRKHGSIDFDEQGIFDLATAALVADSLSESWPGADPGARTARLDLLIIDEMQDMRADWVEALVSQVKAEGSVYLMGDSQQAIYPRDSFDLPGAAYIQCNENYRSPRKIVDAINLLGLTHAKIDARCPEVGHVPDLRVYASADVGGKKALETVVTQLLSEGVNPNQIAIISFAGMGRSEVMGLDHLSGQPISKFTGAFDTAGNPIWRKGSLFMETLYRFKGQAAPYVILCEVDFETFDEKVRRKLFVGMTRAQMHLVVLMSEAAGKVVAEQLNAE
jgi:UvrD-like helicase C-terminal domain/Nuclease-related domain/AAA domain